MALQPVTMGELEETVMNVLWAYEPMTARDVLPHIRRKPALAYTTIKTVMDRLHAKGLLKKTEDGKAFLYRPAVSREAWLAQKAMHALGRSPSDSVLLAFLDSADRADPAMMDRLSALIRTRRERNK